jgi:glutamate 5-kinase
METKLIAAEIATAAGVTTVITSSKHPENIFQIIEYNNALKFAPGTQPEHSSEGTSLPDSESLPERALPVTRPPHTLFQPSPTPMRDLKSWTRHTLFPSGSVIIDSGAHRVLSRRDSGGRLLPVGVVGIIGAFASGQAVRIVVRRRPDRLSAEESKRPTASYIDGTEPVTPNLIPGASLSSSVTSLEQSTSPAEEVTRPTPEKDLVLEGTETEDVIEVGRGLANYNSAQIDRVRGLNR